MFWTEGKVQMLQHLSGRSGGMQVLLHEWKLLLDWLLKARTRCQWEG